MHAAKPPSTFIPGLEGIRGISIALVLGFHADIPFMSGGFIGVDIFFVLSGFLITTILIREFRCTHKIDFIDFYWRRFLRILPPLWFMCGTIAIVGPLVGLNASSLMTDMTVTLTFVSNYTRAQLGIPVWLAQTWSLSLEEQFYLLWPLMAIILMTVLTRWKTIVGVLILLAVSVAVWRCLRYIHGFPPIAIYDGFDTRCDALWIGCVLAFLDKCKLGRLAFLWPFAISIAAVLLFVSKWDRPWMFFGGYTLIHVSGASLIAAAAMRQSAILSAILEFSALRFLGRISYALYLWHWPVVLASSSQGYSKAWCIPIGILFAVVSTWFIEGPIARLKDIGIGWIKMSALVAPLLFVIGLKIILFSSAG